MAMCMKLIDQESVPIDGSASNHNYLVNYPPDMGKVNRVTQHAIGCERTGKIIRRNSSGKLAMSSGERENEGIAVGAALLARCTGIRMVVIWI